MHDHIAVRSLTALAHEHRLAVFRALVVAGEEGLTPSVLTEQLDIASTKLSFHLKELTNAGLVTQQRDGRNLIYRAAYDQMNDLLAYLTENCCQGAECAVDSAAYKC